MDGKRNGAALKVVPTDSVVQTRTADGLKQKPGWPEERPPGQPDDKLAQPAEPEHPPEGRLSFAVQTFFPFLLAGFGMVATGLLLDRASGWYFLSEVPEALVLVPALLGLKGNLEMTLASRLSTMANLGQMDTRRQLLSTLLSNLALVQVQAVGVSLAASLLTIGTALAEGGEFVAARAVSLMLVAIATAAVASLILSTVMVLLAVLARRLRINPDNVCTPIAAMLGDITTLTFMILFGTVLTREAERLFVWQLVLLVLFLLSAGVWALAAARNPGTRAVLKHGWWVVFAAMLVSSGGGYVLKWAMQRFRSLAVFQPVVNGVGGNLVAVQASKISTALHRFGKRGRLPAHRLLTYLNPLRTFAFQEEESVHAFLLLLMSVPGHTIFLTVIFFAELGELYDWRFYLAYVLIGMLQVALLLFVCQLICRLMWRCRVDPDNNAIPLLTSLGDLVGTSLLFLMFCALANLAPSALESMETAALTDS